MTLSFMRKAVFAAKPQFAKIVREHGRSSVFDYYTRLLKAQASTTLPDKRRKELIAEASRQASRLLSKTAATRLVKDLGRNYLVSTAAHHDFATHPFFAHHIVAAAMAGRPNKLRTVPVLSCAGISLNNSSFPRGLLFHNNENLLQHLNLVSLKHRQRPVYGADGYTALARINAITATNREAKRLLTGALAPKITGRDLETQITHAVHALYRKHLETDIIYLPQERVVAELIIRHHLSKKTIFNSILFHAKTRAQFLKVFAGIPGALNLRTQTGTALFWGVVDNKRLALRVVNNMLVSTDKTYRTKLAPDALRNQLRAGRLMPSMALTLTLLSFYYGLTCGGGFSQVNYLTQMKEAYLRLLKRLKMADEYAIASAVATNIFTGEFAIATVGSQPATGLDILTRAEFTKAKLLRLLKTTTLAKAVDRMIPELYKIIAHGK